MNIQEMIERFKDKHLMMWIDERRKVEERLSDEQGTFCVCGRLATGLHERTCRKFNVKVDHETAKSLKIKAIVEVEDGFGVTKMKEAS